MTIWYALAGIGVILIICSTLLLHQYNASKREEKRLVLLDKGLDMVGVYLNKNVSTPYPVQLLAQNSVYEEEDLSPPPKLVGSSSSSGSGTSGSSGSSGSGSFDGSGSDKQKKLNVIYNFYMRYPDATLADGIRSLNIPNGTLSRLHEELVQDGNLEPFPKNR
jgi:hypothetical protein